MKNRGFIKQNHNNREIFMKIVEKKNKRLKKIKK